MRRGWRRERRNEPIEKEVGNGREGGCETKEHDSRQEISSRKRQDGGMERETGRKSR